MLLGTKQINLQFTYFPTHGKILRFEITENYEREFFFAAVVNLSTCYNAHVINHRNCFAIGNEYQLTLSLAP